MKTPAQIQIAINSMERDRTFQHEQLHDIYFGRVDFIAEEKRESAIQKVKKYIEKIENEKDMLIFRLPILDEYKSTLEQIKAQLEAKNKE